MGSMVQIVNLKDKKRSWALFPEPEKKSKPEPHIDAPTQHSGSASPSMNTLVEKIEWQAFEYIFIPKSADWYWAVGLISFLFLLGGVFTGNFLFAIFAITAGFTIALWGARKPKTITVRLNGKGIAVATRFYPYQELTSFWIHYQPPVIKEISLLTKQTLLPSLRIPLGDENPVEIHALLSRFLPEKIEEESLIDIVARALKF